MSCHSQKYSDSRHPWRHAQEQPNQTDFWMNDKVSSYYSWNSSLLPLCRHCLPCSAGLLVSWPITMKDRPESSWGGNMHINGQMQMRFPCTTSWACNTQRVSPICICRDFFFLVVQLQWCQLESSYKNMHKFAPITATCLSVDKLRRTLYIFYLKSTTLHRKRSMTCLKNIGSSSWNVTRRKRCRGAPRASWHSFSWQQDLLVAMEVLHDDNTMEVAGIETVPDRGSGVRWNHSHHMKAAWMAKKQKEECIFVVALCLPWWAFIFCILVR